MSTSALSSLLKLFRDFSIRKRTTARQARRRLRVWNVERLEGRAMLTVSLIGTAGVSLQIDYTNAVAASPTFDVNLNGGIYTVTLSGDTFDQGNANGVTKTANQLTFAANAYPEYLIDTENTSGNTIVTFSGDGATTFLSGWLLSAGSGSSNSFSENVASGATFQNGLVVQGFQTANINSDVTVAESTEGGISAGSSNANSLSIEQSPSGIVQVNAISLAAGITISGSSGNIHLTGAQLVLAGSGTETISAGGTATNTFFNTSGASNLNLPSATIEGAGATSGLSVSANGSIGGGDVTLAGAVSATTTSGSISLGTINTTSTFTANFDTSSSGSISCSANALTATSITITGPGIDDSVSFASDVTATTGGISFVLGTTQTNTGLSFISGNLTAATGDIDLPAASISGFLVQQMSTAAANNVVLGTKLQLFLGGDAPGSGYTQVQYGQLNGGLNVNNSTLDVQLSYVPAGNASFTIFKNEGTGSRTGTFHNLADNSTFVAIDSSSNTAVEFRINYSSNGDIVLTNVSPNVTAPATASVNENSSLTFSTANGNAISVVDAGAIANSDTLALTVTHGKLALGSTAGLTFTSGANNSASMTIWGTLANINAAMNGLMFTPTTGYTGSAALAITAKNGRDNLTSSANVAITVVVPPPTVTAPTTATVNENSSLTFSTANSNAVSLADAAAVANSDTLALSVTHGKLALGSTAGLTFTSGANNSASMTIWGTLANINAGLSGLTFTPTMGYTGSAALALTARNGRDNLTGSATVDITVKVPPPTVTAPATAGVNENSSLTFSTGNGNAISVADIAAVGNSDTFALTVTHGTLVLGSTAGLTFTSGTNGSASMTIWGTLANINAALSGLTFTPTTGYSGSASLTLAAKDGRDNLTGSANVAITVNVPPPSVSAPATASVNRNSSLTFSTANGNAISVADVAAVGNSDTLTLTVTHGTLVLGSMTGLTFTSGANGSASMTIWGTLANINAALSGLTFTPTAGYSGSASLALTAKNGRDNLSGLANIAITVN